MNTLVSPLYEKICSIDFGFLEERMKAKFNWSDERTTNAIKRYRQYLYIVSVEEQGVCPTKDVDEVWHQHILHTRLYEEHCQMIYGKMLHHQPFASSEDKQESKTSQLSDLGPKYFESDYPGSTTETITVECCSDDSECCSTRRKIPVE